MKNRKNTIRYYCRYCGKRLCRHVSSMDRYLGEVYIKLQCADCTIDEFISQQKEENNEKS